jgi:acyl-[acyl-carrier-protein] desaturase
MPLSPAEEARVLPQFEVLRGLQEAVEENLSLLLPIADAWQPTDFLPDLTRADWQEQLSSFRDSARELTDEVLVVLVGDMVTEEALPNYAISLNLIVEDREGTSQNPWAKWMRGWVAEENRHGDLLNAFLRLTGRVDMRSVETTVHHLISGGFNPRSHEDPYAGLIYTSFQERATKISHANVARLAAAHGDENLTRICRKIAGDESRHEQFYTRVMREVMLRDPERGLLIFRDLMRRVIAMPGRAMTDGQDPDLFEHFASVAQRLGVYTVEDYIQILQHLIATWGVDTVSVSGPAAAAQEFLCTQPQRLGKIAENVAKKNAREPPMAFSWINGRKV